MGDGPMEPITTGSVVITPTEMYQEMRDIGRKVDDAAHAVDRLASVIDPALSNMRGDILELKKDLVVGTTECLNDTKAMDVRVRALEHWRWFVLGVAAFVGPVAGVVVTFLFT